MPFLRVYPIFLGPFFSRLYSTVYIITLVAAVLIMVPIGFASFFWQLDNHKSDVKKKKRLQRVEFIKKNRIFYEKIMLSGLNVFSNIIN